MKIRKGAKYRGSCGVIWDDDSASFLNSSSGISNLRHTQIVRDPGCNAIPCKYRQQSEWMYGCVYVCVVWKWIERPSLVYICHEKYLGLYWGRKKKPVVWLIGKEEEEEKWGFEKRTQVCAHTHTCTHVYINTAAPSSRKQGINTGYSLIAPGSRFCRRNGNGEEVSKKSARGRKLYISVTVCLCHENQPTT